MQAATGADSYNDDEDDTPLAMLPASEPAAKHATLLAEHTPVSALRQLPQLTNPANSARPASAALQPSPAVQPHMHSYTPAAGRSEPSLLSSMQNADLEPGEPSPQHDAQQAVVKDAISMVDEAAANAHAHGSAEDYDKDQIAASVNAAAAASPAPSPQLAKAVHDAAQYSNAEGISSNAEAMQHIQTGSDTRDGACLQPSGLAFGPEPQALAVSGADGLLPVARQDDDLISDSESDGPPRLAPQTAHASVNASVVEGIELSMEARKVSPAAPLERPGSPAVVQQQVTVLAGSQQPPPPSSNSDRLPSFDELKEAQHAKPNRLWQDPALQAAEPVQHDSAGMLPGSQRHVVPMMVSDAAVDSVPISMQPLSTSHDPETLPSSAADEACQLQQLAIRAQAGSEPSLHGSSESLLQAEEEATRLARLLAPPVYRPPAIVQQLATLGSTLPLQPISKAVAHGTPADASPAAGQSGIAQALVGEAGQHPQAHAGLPVSEASPEQESVAQTTSTKLQQLMLNAQQEAAEATPSSGLQDMAVQIIKERLQCTDPAERDQSAVSEAAQHQALPSLQDTADVIVPDR